MALNGSFAGQASMAVAGQGMAARAELPLLCGHDKYCPSWYMCHDIALHGAKGCSVSMVMLQCRLETATGVGRDAYGECLVCCVFIAVALCLLLCSNGMWGAACVSS
jgi:hypothetical protein